MNIYKYTAIFTLKKEDGEEYYDVSIPAYPEICTFGDSLEEARFMAQDALELVVLSRLEEGEEVVGDKKPTTVSKNAIIEEILVTVSHEVKSTPLTQDVKAAIA